MCTHFQVPTTNKLSITVTMTGVASCTMVTAGIACMLWRVRWRRSADGPRRDLHHQTLRVLPSGRTGCRRPGNADDRKVFTDSRPRQHHDRLPGDGPGSSGHMYGNPWCYGKRRKIVHWKPAYTLHERDGLTKNTSLEDVIDFSRLYRDSQKCKTDYVDYDLKVKLLIKCTTQNT